jgi:hypothetical protein
MRCDGESFKKACLLCMIEGKRKGGVKERKESKEREGRCVECSREKRADRNLFSRMKN